MTSKIVSGYHLIEPTILANYFFIVLGIIADVSRRDNSKKNILSYITSGDMLENYI